MTMQLVLWTLQHLIFPEIGQFVVKRVTPEGADASLTWTNYGALERDYLQTEPAPVVKGEELRAALLELLTDVVEPLKAHMTVTKKKKKGFLGSILTKSKKCRLTKNKSKAKKQ